ncbi:ribonuclease HII-domain-containing protein [Dipodascopsis tothii]|uniref:ribonuclease HII-domain-containing protein n=1 Tax=Dipodascopsis tothii TaxID=44089 RepID=UPI0034CF322A
MTVEDVAIKYEAASEQIEDESESPQEFVGELKGEVKHEPGSDSNHQVPGLPVGDESCTYLSPIPATITDGAPCVLGVDEAGRGPVLGPMVYAAAYCLKSYKDELATQGFADSKVLTAGAREALLERMCDSSDLAGHIGWTTRTMSARDISAGMLRAQQRGSSNLNEQAHDATIALIRGVAAAGVNIAEIYVDTVGPPGTYQAKLARLFPHAQVTVAKKADSLYPVVSAASVAAKVTRDAALATRADGAEWGSGYPSDPRTSRWLAGAVDPVFGWEPIVRFSWQTARDALTRGGAAAVDWPEEDTLASLRPRATVGWFGSAVDF